MDKIAIVCHDHCLSGANKALLDYLCQKNKLDYVIVILPRKNLEFEKKLTALNIKVLYLNVFTIVKHLNKLTIIQKIKLLLKKAYNAFFKQKHLNKIIKQLQNENVKCILSNSCATLNGYYIAQTMNIEHTFHVREFMELDHQITYEDGVNIATIFEKSSAIFISKTVEQHYLSKYKFKDSVVIYDAIRFNNEYSKKRKFMEDGQLNIIIVGTLQNNKGQIDAVKAVHLLSKKCNNLNLYICGDGPNRDLIQAYIEQHKLNNIKLLGNVSDVSQIHKNMDIALVCSRMEALGRVTLEAMFYENLLIGSNAGETKELIGSDRGFLYKSGDETDLASKLEHVLAIDSKQYNQIIKKSKDYVVEYLKNDIFNEVISFVQKKRI